MDPSLCGSNPTESQTKAELLLLSTKWWGDCKIAVSRACQQLFSGFNTEGAVETVREASYVTLVVALLLVNEQIVRNNKFFKL